MCQNYDIKPLFFVYWTKQIHLHKKSGKIPDFL